jgi:hypothetical protein
MAEVSGRAGFDLARDFRLASAVMDFFHFEKGFRRRFFRLTFFGGRFVFISAQLDFDQDQGSRRSG